MIWLVLLAVNLIVNLSFRADILQFDDCHQLRNQADTQVTDQVTRLIGYVELSSLGGRSLIIADTSHIALAATAVLLRYRYPISGLATDVDLCSLAAPARSNIRQNSAKATSKWANSSF